MENLIFNPKIASNKPNDLRSTGSTPCCPFCNKANLTDILKSQNESIWLVNKYRTLENTYQTLVIESEKHNGDFSNYSDKEALDIIQFAIDCWKKMEKDPKFKSVAMYKNYGPVSGGSLKHPHIQIVGFKNINCYELINKSNFIGLNVLSNNDTCVTISTNPVMGFTEVNIMLKNNIRMFSNLINKICSYFMNEYYNGNCNSYNMFFYEIEGAIYTKIIPRFIDSPYFVGYKIPQLNSFDRLNQIKKELIESF